jgi:hypothetical protein
MFVIFSFDWKGKGVGGIGSVLQESGCGAGEAWTVRGQHGLLERGVVLWFGEEEYKMVLLKYKKLHIYKKLHR